ncbi:MAG: hypothetical protein ACE145_18955 [Terriglobia bacterium]
MPRFLIEVPHEAERAGCVRAVEIFHRTGSHFLTHAEWGCKDGVHNAWIIAEVENKDEARFIPPPPYRARARITELIQYNIEQVDEWLAHHQQR